jgi:hypothetical protein
VNQYRSTRQREPEATGLAASRRLATEKRRGEVWQIGRGNSWSKIPDRYHRGVGFVVERDLDRTP